MAETAAAGATDLDARVEAFEAAWAAGGPPDLARFLPPADAPGYLSVLSELVRIDLEMRSDRGEPARIDPYARAFPGLFADGERLREVAFEEFRLRAAAGEAPDPREYARKYRIDTSGWPAPSAPSPFAGAVSVLSASRAATAARPRYPEPGETVLDFRVVQELGRGAFGRVYLAEQTGLAGRPVAVKLSTRFGRAEPETLARLQHTHIVPVYSTHEVGPFQAVVMPFLGGTTLADVLADLRGRGAWPASGKDLADTLAGRHSQTAPASGPADPRPAAAKPGVSAAALARFTFPEAVLWVGAKLADALAHAHDRGVLHRDVKPANVLLTDAGQPMLLDFNLAADAGRGPAGAGGTPAYMAPEQLRALRGDPAAVDARADVYGLGLVLFELLTGRHPYPVKDGPAAEMLRGRLAPPPRLRPLNPAITPAAEAIVRRCLEPDPAARYPSAAALAEDLERQLADRPLAHTPEPSVRERLRKWRRRNPRLTSAGAIGAAAAVLLAVAAGLGLVWYERSRQLERERVAGEEYRGFRDATPGAVENLTLHANDPRRRAAGAEFVSAALARYGPPDAAGWDSRPPGSLLPQTDRAELRDQLAELQYLRSLTTPGPEAGRPPAGREAYLEGLRHLHRGEYKTAVDSLTAAVEQNPGHYWSHLLLGVAYSGLRREGSAEACFRTCIALRPDYPFGLYNRGLARLRQKNFAAAEADFTETLRLKAGHPDALVGRAQARLGLKRPHDAALDLTAALETGASETRLLFLRAAARDQAGDAPGAAADRERGLASTPTDEVGWVGRGLSKAGHGDAAGAIADFDAALRINPRSYVALQNKAYVLDLKLHREAESVAVLDKLIELYADDFESRGGRAVLLARRGNRTAAHADAEHCLGLAPPPGTVYQLAGVYALTSKTHPEDARTAFRLLADALRQDYGFEYVENKELDPDLEPVRKLPEFELVVQAAKAVRPRPAAGK